VPNRVNPDVAAYEVGVEWPEERYYQDTLLLPEVDHFGWASRIRHRMALEAHEHPEAYEFCLIVRGRADWWVGSDMYQVNAGDVFLTAPKEQHGSVDGELHPQELYWLIIRIEPDQPLPGLTPEQSAELARRMARLERRCFASTPATRLGYEQLRDCHHTPGEPLVTARARTALHQVLLGILHDHELALRDDAQPGRSDVIQRSLAWINDHIADDITVEQAAEAVGLGVSRFHERFREEVGITPAEYFNRRRVELSKQRLRDTDAPITRIAMQLGFSSSQYFATVFGKLTGMTPSEYRKHRR